MIRVIRTSLALAFILALQPLHSEEQKLTITELKGSPMINGKPAKVGDTISKGQLLQSGKEEKDYVEVRTSDDHHIRLVGGQLNFENIGKKFKAKLKNGTLFSHVDKLDKDEDFYVHTRQSIAGIRGTKFFLKDEDGRAYLCVCEGVVTHQHIDKPEEIHHVQRGQDHHVHSDKMVGTPMDSPQMFQMVQDVFLDMGYNMNERKKMRGGR